MVAVEGRSLVVEFPAAGQALLEVARIKEGQGQWMDAIGVYEEIMSAESNGVLRAVAAGAGVARRRSASDSMERPASLGEHVDESVPLEHGLT